MTMNLHKNSLDYLNSVFEYYIKVPHSNKEIDNKVLKDPIIHMYPHSDTYDELGNLHGYRDSLFFKVVIYDTSSMRTYELERKFDAVDTLDSHLAFARIFKDGSTLLKFIGEHSFYQTATLNARKMERMMK